MDAQQHTSNGREGGEVVVNMFCFCNTDWPIGVVNAYANNNADGTNIIWLAAIEIAIRQERGIRWTIVTSSSILLLRTTLYLYLLYIKIPPLFTPEDNTN